MAERIAVHGVVGDRLSPAAEAEVGGATLVAGAARLLARARTNGASVVELGGDLASVMDQIEASEGTACVLASGDPGFFGIVRVLSERFGAESLDVHPAPSAVSLAFARIGIPWDDAAVVSAHGRPLAEAARLAARAPKVAVLTSPESPPQALGRALIGLGRRHSEAIVCSRLGTDSETITRVGLPALAGGEWDPLSVVVLIDGNGVASEPARGWGLPDRRFDHRGGMVTKAEIRAVALGKLACPPEGVLWDVAAGSASVAIECARLSPSLQVFAIEKEAGSAERARHNAASHRVDVQVVVGTAPAALEPLPHPDRAFVGGGGLDVLDATLSRLRPGGRMVATYAAVDRAAAAYARLGHLVEVAVSRGERLPDGGVRLVALNPVFLVWGPEE